ncbi:MAG: type II toxin-antitoxin system HicA family toxin [Nitrososphaeraceae archaeon]
MSLKNHSHRQIIKILTKYYGFSLERQSGSHIQLKHLDGRRVTVPRHDPIKVGVMKAIIEQAKTTQEEFLKYLK